MVFYNSSNSIGIIIDAATNNVTGDMFLTLMGLLILILVCFMMFRIPLLYSAVLILPLMLVLMAYTSEFRAVGGVLLMYLAVLLANYWVTRD